MRGVASQRAPGDYRWSDCAVFNGPW